MKETMMIRKSAIVVVVALALAAPALAQEREEQKEKVEPKMAIQPPAPRERTQAVNVRLDVTITDQTSGGEPAVKTLSLLAADGSWSRVRSEGVVWTSGGQYPISLRVDARPQLLQGDKVHLNMIVEYKPTAPEPKAGASATTLTESCEVVLEGGKPLVVSQAADPNSDRKVRLEVKGTILK